MILIVKEKAAHKVTLAKASNNLNKNYYMIIEFEILVSFAEENLLMINFIGLAYAAEDAKCIIDRMKETYNVGWGFWFIINKVYDEQYDEINDTVTECINALAFLLLLSLASTLFPKGFIYYIFFILISMIIIW